MADEPRWDDIFPAQNSSPTPVSPVGPPMTRKEALAAEGRTRPSEDGPAKDRKKKPRKSRKGWLIALISVVVILGLGAGGAAFAWANYEPQIRKLLGWEIPPPDYVGKGSGEATIVIVKGDTGVEVTNSLVDAGVIKSFETFYSLLLAQDPPVDFYPGYYVLAKKMSSQAALDALRDPASRVEQTALIPEGKSIDQVFEILSTATGISVEDFKTAASDPTSYGAPVEAPSLEGYLFPATYHFDPGLDARAVLQILVNRTFQSLDAAGVAPDDRHRVLTLASIIQREAGRNTEDFYKVSRVFTNRLNAGWHLESDATVSYGTGRTHTVWTTPEERADASNKYNTYANPGLPIGPIGAAGDLAIDAALHPADGPWFYFVPVNLDTGETVFSTTLAEHNAAVRQLQEWCRTSKSPNCQ
ncbi:MAG: endolytic transglycosylase MltG [Cryobacterium sp.]|nr:endolytic transglycosylase MltG [Cryobacterium sp.]